MTTEIDRPLDELEKSLLCWLAIQVVEAQTDADEQTVADAIDTLAGEGQAIVKADTGTRSWWSPATRWCIAAGTGWRGTPTSRNGNRSRPHDRRRQ